MAVWKCEDCGYTKESKCKPKKCPECQKTSFARSEGPACKK